MRLTAGHCPLQRCALPGRHGRLRGQPRGIHPGAVADHGAFGIPDGVDDMTALFVSDAAATG
jgi:hypothetical protein